MIKLIALMRRKAGLTLEQFRDYYETRHAPLTTSLFNFARYERNFIDPDTVSGGFRNDAPGFPYDVVTEMWFHDEAHYQKMIDDIANTDVGPRLAADEENFLDRASITAFLVTTTAL